MSIEPDWVSPPGETIERIMASRELAADELSDCLGMERDDFDKFLVGEARIDVKLARLLAENIGSSPRFWMSRDAQYLQELERIKAPSDASLEQWVKQFPVASLRRLGILPTGRGAKVTSAQLLDFFGCQAVAEWNAKYASGLDLVDYRASQSFVADDFSTLAWRRLGEMQAASLDLNEFSRDYFCEVLPDIKRLSAFKNPKTVVEKLRGICAETGVALTTARSPQGCRASGATWVSERGNPVIHLSFRHMSDDHFWFTFYHEAAHIILHRGEHVDTDKSLSSSADKKEREANEFAANMLVPEEIRAQLASIKITPKVVMKAARLARVSPGIIAGQLEHNKVVPPGKLSFLKTRYKWAGDNTVPELS